MIGAIYHVLNVLVLKIRIAPFALILFTTIEMVPAQLLVQIRAFIKIQLTKFAKCVQSTAEVATLIKYVFNACLERFLDHSPKPAISLVLQVLVYTMPLASAWNAPIHVKAVLVLLQPSAPNARRDFFYLEQNA